MGRGVARKFHPAGVAMVALETCELDAPSMRFVLAALALHANTNFETRPGTDRIAKLTGLAPRTVKGALKALREAGVIVEIEPGGGRGYASVYRLNDAVSAPFKGAASAPLDGQRVHERVQNTALNGAASAPQHIEHMNFARACARLRSSFLSNGLAALEEHHPDVAANWGSKIVDAEIADGALMVQTTTRHAANFLRTNHGDKLLAAFAPSNGVGRLVVEAIQ